MTSSNAQPYVQDPSQSPSAPPHSPITPAIQFAEPLPSSSRVSSDPPASPKSQPKPSSQASGSATFISQPPAITVPEDDNIDAIALRAAIYTLQIQKEKSIRDVKTLQKLKSLASDDPERFLDEYSSGKLRHEAARKDPLAATFEDVNEEEADDEDDEETEDAREGSSFPTIPSHQKVVRCPPINWSKYQIVGAPLDRMHEEQRRRPTPGEPATEGSLYMQPQHEHAIYAPYDPLKDRIEQGQAQVQPYHPMVTRRTSTKPG